MCSSSEARIFENRSRETKSPTLSLCWMAAFRSGTACISSRRSHTSASFGVSPIINLPRFCRLGKPSRNRMRSISASACFISSMDSLYSCSASSFRPQFLYMRACRKYWLIAMSSLYSALLRCWMTDGSPFMAAPSLPLTGFELYAFACADAETKIAPIGKAAIGILPLAALAHPCASRPLRAQRAERRLGGAQDRQAQWARAVVLVEQLRRHVQATAAAGAGAGTHGQLMDFAHTLFRRAADLVVGDSVTDAHVHFAARSIENDSHLAANENGCQ